MKDISVPFVLQDAGCRAEGLSPGSCWGAAHNDPQSRLLEVMYRLGMIDLSMICDINSRYRRAGIDVVSRMRMKGEASYSAIANRFGSISQGGVYF